MREYHNSVCIWAYSSLYVMWYICVCKTCSVDSRINVRLYVDIMAVGLIISKTFFSYSTISGWNKYLNRHVVNIRIHFKFIWHWRSFFFIFLWLLETAILRFDILALFFFILNKSMSSFIQAKVDENELAKSGAKIEIN